MATLREIIDFSKNNPNTDYAKRAYELIKQGDFDEQAKKEGIDLSWAGRNTSETPKESGFIDKVNEVSKGFIEPVFNAEVGAAKGAASTIAEGGIAPMKVAATASDISTQNTYNEARDSLTKANENLLKVYKGLPDGDPKKQKYKDMIMNNLKSLEQINSESETATQMANTFGEKPDFLQPKGLAEKIGYGAEKIGEFVYGGKKLAAPATSKIVLPGEKAIPFFSKLLRIGAGAASEGVAAGTVTAAQTGGDIKETAKNAGLAALISLPFKALNEFGQPVGQYLKESAEKKASQALGATTIKNKELSEKVIPGLLKKRVFFVTRKGLENKVSNIADDIGEQIDSAFNALPAEAKSDVAPILKNIEDVKNQLVISGTNKVPEVAATKYKALQNMQMEILGLGKNQVVEDAIARHLTSGQQVLDEAVTNGAKISENTIGPLLEQTKKNIVDGLRADGFGEYADAIEKTAVNGLKSMQDLHEAVSESLLNNGLMSAKVESLRSFRQILDNIIKDAKGGFGLTGSENATLAAEKAGANSIRNELSQQYPNIAKLNKEFNFWKNVEKVVGDTVKRTKSQGTPLGETIAETGGAAGSIARGGKAGSVILTGLGLKLLKQVVTSPAWRMASGIIRNDLANAIYDSNTGKFFEIANRLLYGAVNQ